MPDILVPVITSIALTQNPVETSGLLTISVSVTEAPLVPQYVYPYAGEVYAGEVTPWQ